MISLGSYVMPASMAQLQPHPFETRTYRGQPTPAARRKGGPATKRARSCGHRAFEWYVLRVRILDSGRRHWKAYPTPHRRIISAAGAGEGWLAGWLRCATRPNSKLLGPATTARGRCGTGGCRGGRALLPQDQIVAACSGSSAPVVVGAVCGPRWSAVPCPGLRPALDLSPP